MRNRDGYSDPTAAAAIGAVMEEYRKQRRAKFRRQYELMHRKKVYVVSPYAGEVYRNIVNTKWYCRFVIKEGAIPIASHLMYPRFLNDMDPEERELGIMFGFSLMEGCDEVWVFTENGISEGMRREIHEAKRQKKRIRLIAEVK